MDRANSKHSRWLDDEMARETQDYTIGVGAGTRTVDWRDAEPPGDDQPEAAPIPDPVDENERLSDFGRYVPRSVLPADRDALLIGAARMRAPDVILDQLDRLEPEREYATVAEVWEALGHPMDHLHR